MLFLFLCGGLSVEGIVTKWEETIEGSSGTIQTSDGDWYKVSGGFIESDTVGRVYLEINEPVVFEVGEDHITGNGKRIRTAVNVRRPFKDVTTEWRTHREYCEVLDRNWLLRIYGGRLSLSYNDCAVVIQPRFVVTCGAKPPEKGQVWRAYDVKVVSENAETFAWESIPRDGFSVETPVASPAPATNETESALLSDRLRGVKLKHIRRSA
jgi:hypothetical protein